MGRATGGTEEKKPAVERLEEEEGWRDERKIEGGK